MNWNRLIISDIAPWLVTGALVTLLLYLLASIPKLITGLRALPRSVAIALFLCVIGGAAVRFGWVPNVHRIYFDEDRYLMYATSFARTGHALGIQIATPTEVLRGDPDPGARVTVPTIHAWVMRIFGYTDANLFAAAKVLSTVQIIFIFIYTYLLFRLPLAALFAAFGMAFLPVTVFWSTTTNLDSLFVLFGLLTATAALLYAQKSTWQHALFLFISMLLLLFVRIEGLMFIPIIFVTFATVRRQNKQVLFTTGDIRLLFPIVPLLLTRLYVALPLFSQTWCCAEATPLEIFQVQYFFRNTIPNLEALFVRPEFPFIITVFAFVALFGIRDHIYKWIIATWIACYFFVYSFYYAGIFFSYTFSGSYGRFFLILIPPLLSLAGLTVAHIYHQFERGTFRQKNRILLATILVALTLYPTVMGYRRFIHLSPWDMMVDEGPRVVRNFLVNELLPNTPVPSVIIHPLTAEILMQKKSAVSLEAFLFQEQGMAFVEEQIKAGVPVYLFETGVCDTNPYKCIEVRKRFTFKPISLGQSATQGIGISQVSLNEEPIP
jgi:hypothetical protein